MTQCLLFTVLLDTVFETVSKNELIIYCSLYFEQFKPWGL